MDGESDSAQRRCVAVVIDGSSVQEVGEPEGRARERHPVQATHRGHEGRWHRAAPCR